MVGGVVPVATPPASPLFCLTHSTGAIALIPRGVSQS